MQARPHTTPAIPALPHQTWVRATIDRLWNGREVASEGAIHVAVGALSGDVWIAVDAPFYGDPAPEAVPGSVDGLWAYEVVEVMFLGCEERYLEVELGPHGHYLVLTLDGVRNPVRQGMPIDFVVGRYTCRRGATRWTGLARVPSEWIPHKCDKWNAFAIQGVGESRRYLAWRPAGGDVPDFHKLAAFGSWFDGERWGP